MVDIFHHVSSHVVYSLGQYLWLQANFRNFCSTKILKNSNRLSTFRPKIELVKAFSTIYAAIALGEHQKYFELPICHVFIPINTLMARTIFLTFYDLFFYFNDFHGKHVAMMAAAA